jgi:hypothetical protein
MRIRQTFGATLRDAGVLTASLTFAELGGDLQLVSFDVLGEHGPHPSLTSDVAVCDVVAPALGKGAAR